MDTKEYTPVTNCLALTVRKEHRLTVIKRATRTTIRISWKTLLYALFLTVANILVQNLIFYIDKRDMIKIKFNH